MSSHTGQCIIVVLQMLPINGSLRMLQGNDRLGCRGGEKEGQPWEAVDVDESMWCLEDDVDEAQETVKTLMISLIRPPPTEREISWKKGSPQLWQACIPNSRQSIPQISAIETWINHA